MFIVKTDYFHGMALTPDKTHSMVKKCRPWLKLMLMSEPLMVICFTCFVLVSLKPETTRCTKVLHAVSPGPPDLEKDGNHTLRSVDK